MMAASKWVFFIFTLTTLQVFAQNDFIAEPTLLLRHRQLFGFNLNTAELGGINYKYQWQKTALVKNGFEIELARLRHPKEERIYGQSENPKKYTPGRINMAFFLRTGYGQNIFITDRQYKNAISLHYNYSVGATTVFLKPIYIEVIKSLTDPTGSEFLATEKYDPANKHTTPSLIYGNAPFTTGIEETSVRVGGHFKNSLSVEWGQYPDAFNSIEAGFVIDVFGQKLPMMAESVAKNRNIIFTFFLGFYIGSNK